MVEARVVVVADTSVIINLNATARAAEILNALPYRVVITDIVATELQEDRRIGRNDSEMLEALATGEHLKVVSLDEPGLRVFEALVVGAAGDTLDDGEAATIAHAVEHDIDPVIDERKALRICAERFPGLRPKTTVDLFAETSVVAALGRDVLSEAVFRALRDARMRVALAHVGWVLGLIGSDRASQCPSLPKSARGP